ncbi:MAG TPA: phosphoglycerate dehydrogenase [Blastocatellia bacterium]|jgi:D-3-phosphoglycerate dehydrogenase|nr:phosphoglycerate dehydrogenase [Blastocatellia bacterium]
MRILVCDGLEKNGVEILRAASGIAVDERPSIGADELAQIITDYDALIVRSKTKVTADLIERARTLRVVGRAGTGVDNIDVEAATRRGIVVMNAAAGNTVTTAEHTWAMLMAMARQIPQAAASTKAGRWEKNRFLGVELMGKTLGVVGLGRIGSAVAERARAFGMNVLAYDPYFTPEAARELGIEMLTLDEIFPRADFITIHTPLTEETRGIINSAAIEKMKPGVRLINCARGGLIDERALAAALSSGKVAGAALDVFEQEPTSPDNPLLAFDQVIATPHLGASTTEAQLGVATIIAEQVLDYLKHATVRGAVNMPAVSAELLAAIGPYIVLGEKIGLFQGKVFGHDLREVLIEYSGDVTEQDVKPITQSILAGLLSPVIERVNMVNAALVAEHRGIKVTESISRRARDYASMIRVRAVTAEQESEVAGALFGRRDGRIVRINGFNLEAIPKGHMLLLFNRDEPGVLGRVATFIGDHRVNISRLYLGRKKIGERALALIQIDQQLAEDVLRQLATLPAVISVKQLKL